MLRRRHPMLIGKAHDLFAQDDAQKWILAGGFKDNTPSLLLTQRMTLLLMAWLVRWQLTSLRNSFAFEMIDIIAVYVRV